MVLDRAINTPSDGPWSHKKSSGLHLVQSKVVHFGKKIIFKVIITQRILNSTFVSLETFPI